MDLVFVVRLTRLVTAKSRRAKTEVRDERRAGAAVHEGEGGFPSGKPRLHFLDMF